MTSMVFSRVDKWVSKLAAGKRDDKPNWGIMMLKSAMIKGRFVLEANNMARRILMMVSTWGGDPARKLFFK